MMSSTSSSSSRRRSGQGGTSPSGGPHLSKSKRGRKSSTDSSIGIHDLEKLLNDSGQWPKADDSHTGDDDTSGLDAAHCQDQTVDPMELRMFMSESFNDENYNNQQQEATPNGPNFKANSKPGTPRDSRSQKKALPASTDSKATGGSTPMPLEPTPRPHHRSGVKPPRHNGPQARGGGGGVDRRQTADAADLEDLLRGLISPAASRNSLQGRATKDELTRRLTADPDALQQLLHELSSPGRRASLSMSTPEGKALRQTLKELQMSFTDEDSLTAVSILEKALDEGDKTGGSVVPARSSSGQERQGSSDGRRMTADACSLEILVADLEAEEEAHLPPKDQKKDKTPVQPQRRTTASPTSLARVMQELDEADEPPVVRPPIPPAMPTVSASPMLMGGRRDSLAMLQGTGYVGDGGQHHRASQPSTRRSPRFRQSRAPPVSAEPTADQYLGGGSPTAAETMEEPPSTEGSPPLNVQGPQSLMSPAPLVPSARKPLRSCLSSRKEPNRNMSPPGSIAKKTVVFGSPDAALFHKNSPTTSLTPMARQEVQRFFPQFQPGLSGMAEQEEEPPETGLTAENSAILAEWEADGDDIEEEASSRRKSTSSTKRRRSESQSPRPRRRQSLLLSRNQRGGVYGVIDQEEEEDEAARDAAGRAMKENLPVDMDIDEDGDEAKASMANDDDDMPDIRAQPADFRSQDERTSAELGIIGGTGIAMEGMAEGDNTVELEADLHGLLATVSDQSNREEDIIAKLDEQEEDPEQSFLDADITCHGQAPMVEEHTVELEPDLGALMMNAATEVKEGGGNDTGFPPDEHTVDLEADLNALVRGAAGDDKPPDTKPSTSQGTTKGSHDPVGLDMSLASDDDEDDADPSMSGDPDGPSASKGRAPPRFSFSSDTSQPSPAPKMRRTPVHRPSTSSLDSMEDTPRPVTRSSRRGRSSVSSTSSSNGRRRATAGSSSTNFFAISPCTSSELPTTESSPGASPQASAAIDDSIVSEASPFAHIQVAHLGKKSQQLQRPAKSRRSSSSDSNTMQGKATTHSEQTSSTPSSITVSGLASTTCHGLSSPAMTVSSSSVSGEVPQQTTEPLTVDQALELLDWAAVASSLQAPACRMSNWIQSLMDHLESEGLGKAGPRLAARISQAYHTGLAAQMSGIQAVEVAGGLDTLKEIVSGWLSSVSASDLEAQASRLQATIARSAPQFAGYWNNVEKRVLEGVLEEMRQMMVLYGTENEALAAMDKASQLQGRADTMMAHIHTQMRQCKRQRRVEALRGGIDTRRQAVSQAQEELQKLAACKQEQLQKIKDMQEFIEKAANRKQKMECSKTLQTRMIKAQSKVTALEERINLSRALHLGQPLDLSSEKLSLVFLHCDGSKTEVYMAMNDTTVTSLSMRHEQMVEASLVGPLAQALLGELIQQCPPFTGIGPPTHHQPPTKSWSLKVPTTEIPKAVRRLEVIVGRAEQLTEAVSRVEEAYPCSLVMGPDLLEKESWVEQCMIGTSTTCQFECTSASKEDPSCLIIKAMGEPAMLAPQCAAVLTVKVSPRVTVKFALSLGFLSTIPTKIVAQPDVLARSGRQALKEALSPLLFSKFACHKRSTTSTSRQDVTQVLVKACQTIKDRIS